MNSYCDFFFPFFFPPPSYLKGSSEDYESVESHVLNKGSGVDTEVTGKQSLAINTEQTTETTKQAELNCWAKAWLEIPFRWECQKFFQDFDLQTNEGFQGKMLW